MSKENTKESVMIDYSEVYYTYWLSQVAHKYFEQDRIYGLALMLEMGKGRDLNWLFACVDQVVTVKKASKEKASNMEARLLGRAGEQLVYNKLVARDWEVVGFTSQDLYPKFGTSPTSHDIMAKFGDGKERLIEVKSFRDEDPFFYVSYRHKRKIDQRLSANPRHYHAFVKGDKVWYVRTNQIKYIGYVQSYINRCGRTDWKYLWVVDPKCLKELL